jgi:hypothetical protein
MDERQYSLFISAQSLSESSHAVIRRNENTHLPSSNFVFFLNSRFCFRHRLSILSWRVHPELEFYNTIPNLGILEIPRLEDFLQLSVLFIARSGPRFDSGTIAFIQSQLL